MGAVQHGVACSHLNGKRAYPPDSVFGMWKPNGRAFLLVSEAAAVVVTPYFLVFREIESQVMVAVSAQTSFRGGVSS